MLAKTVANKEEFEEEAAVFGIQSMTEDRQGDKKDQP